MRTTLATGSDAARRRAFTLVELAVVVFILAVMMAVAIPSFSRSYRGALFRQIVQDSATTCQLARLQAVLHQQPVTLHVDLSRQHLWLSQPLSGEAATNAPSDAVFKVIEVKAPVSILSAQRAGEAPLREGETTVRFDPNGTAEAFTVVFQGGERDELLAIQLDPVTGRATVVEVRR